MGGLARRVSYIKAFKHRSNGEVPALFVDAGNLFTDDKFTNEILPVEVQAKNKWVVKAYGDFRHDAANITTADLPYMAELLKKDGYDQRLKDFPFIKKLISANVRPADDTRMAPEPFIIREVTLKRGNPNQKVRVGIIGVTAGKSAMSNQAEFKHAGFVIDDPFQAAKNVISELKPKVDFIVALAYMQQEELQRLASENPEIDTIIGAGQYSKTEDPVHFNRATITTAYNQTKYVGELRVYVRGDGSIENQLNRYVGLDGFIPDDPMALETVTAAHDEFTNEQNKSAKSNVQPTNILSSKDSPFVGADTCAGCHVEEKEIWDKTGHAHAMATLERKNQQFDNECVKCHVVGFEKGGFQSLVTTPQYANVQCESCHGPGKQHAANPQKGYGFMQTPTGCVDCHNPVNSPDFNFKTYWPKVKHGKRELANLR
jgi:2',3'-cyclic-nucleotide 2'-phosphodiesterase (5'-nucleotidase family)